MTCKDVATICGGLDEPVEGHSVAGRAPSISEVYVPTRGELCQDVPKTQQASDEASKAGVLGREACGSGYAFDVYLYRRWERTTARKASCLSRASSGEGGEAVVEVVVRGRRGAVRVPDDGGQRGDGAGSGNNMKAGRAAGYMP